MANNKPDKKINLRIRTVTSTKEYHFNEESSLTIAELRTKAFEKMDIHPAPGQQWVFKRENGALLDNDAQTLAEAGLHDKDLLIFGVNDVLGGHAPNYR